MRVIRTAALTLEPQLAAHADAMFVVLSDPAIYEHENAPPPSAAWLRERYARLETRRSADGREAWLNWVVRLPSGELAGYVQATVYPAGLRPEERATGEQGPQATLRVAAHAGGLRRSSADRRSSPSAAFGDSRSLAPPDLRPGPRLAAHADIAYELASRYWGRGLARAAVEAMIGELIAEYGVSTLAAILKRTNERSRRLLERLGFALAPPERHALRQIEPDEMLMERAARCA